MATLSELKRQYQEASEAYYNKEPIMTDSAFDKLEDRIRKLDPEWEQLKKTGVRVGKNEVKLEYLMPSLPKIYPEHAAKWLEKYGKQHIAMKKLDGTSLQLKVVKGKPVSLKTRGDGSKGKDVSHLLSYLTLPRSGKFTGTIRCEGMMRRDVFDRKWANQFDNPRNLVNGLFNRKTAHKALADVSIVGLGVFGLHLVDGLDAIEDWGLEAVHHEYDRWTPKNLETTLKNWRKGTDYEMDGLVLAPADFEYTYTTTDRPKGIVAFKINDEANAAQVKVIDVIWQVSSHGRFTPKIEIEPTRMDGVTVKFCTAHNAKWMKDRGIGKGATVKVLRSGGVIPKIVGVVKKASFSEPSQSHQWKGVHLYTAEGTSDATEDRIQVLQTVKFLRTLGIELLAAKSVQQLIGVLPNPLSYVRNWSRGALVSKLLDGGIGEKNAIKIAVEFNRVLSKPIRMTDLMVATHVFDVGVGRRRLEAIEAAGIPMGILLEDSPKSRIKLISSLHGFSDKTAKLVSDGMEEFKPLHAKLAKYLKIDGKLPQPKKIKVKSGKLSGQSVSWTGYRDKDEEAAVEAAGGQVVPFGSKTTILLVKDGGKASSKVEKAESKGILVKKFNELGIS